MTNPLASSSVVDGAERVPLRAQGAAPASNTPAGSRPIACIRSEQLLAGATEVHIEHRGAIYRLKQTSLGKLILTK